VLQACQARILRLLNDLIPPPSEHALPFDNHTLAKISRPVTELRQFANWVHSNPAPVPGEEFEALRKFPRIWFDRIKVVADIEPEVRLVG
jgi:hypothetical protein